LAVVPIGVALCAGAVTAAFGEPAPPLALDSAHGTPLRHDLAELDAPQAVRTANQRLLGGDPAAALDAYRHAEQLRPDAREIAFGEGLAHYELGEFDLAREAFRKAAASGDDLAVDARYSLGTCDHREALSKAAQPQEAIGLLESAMRQYHDVLAERPNHAAARDANRKAASMWRQIKQQLQQQQQQKNQEDGTENQNQEEQQDQQDQQQKSSDREQEQQDQQASPSEQTEEQQQQESEPPQNDRSGEEQKQKEGQQPQQDPQDNKTEPHRAAEQEEQVSREQAERQLREMMQSVRDRRKTRREVKEPVHARPVDRDW
jgi:Ca-activated chloride channel family protein